MAQSDPSSTLTGSSLPACFRDLAPPPEALYVHGTLPPGPYVGVVGTRKPSPEAERFTIQCCRRLASRGVTVVSGGALGIDAAAHEGALAGKGPTVVVAPCSFEFPYPPEHAELFQRVVRQGCFLSEHSRAVKAFPGRFFRRNSLLVALCQVLVVIEAPLRSGARNAALWARRLGRPVLVVPGAPWNPKARGTLEELRLGALPLCSVQDVIALLPQGAQRLALARRALPPSPRSSPRSRSSVSAAADAAAAPQLGWWQEPAPGAEPSLEVRIVHALSLAALLPDALLERVAIGPQALHQSLLQLQLSGRVERDVAGRYRLTGWDTKDRAH